MRQSGVLLHITSLPTEGMFGTLGKEAYQFVDWLRKAGMSIWQVLPVGPTGYGESPYQSTCTHAGSIYMIDLDTLKKEGLLTDDADLYSNAKELNFENAKARHLRALKKSFEESYARLKDEVSQFIDTHPSLNDYSLFMAVKDYFGGKMWTEWPDIAIRMREEKAIEHYGRILGDEVNFYKYTQYLFFKQWTSLKSYANKNGISIFGDIPIYVSEDSSDTWANPEIFQLDRDRRPVKVAGVPPDYFSEDGQLWGNPLYDWKKLKKTGYAWWINRLKTTLELYDMVRVDHFIGFANYYSIRAGAPNARVGKWEKAPGKHFFSNVKRKLPELNVIAEDLGVISKRVKRLLRFCGYPGMKVLSFGFDGGQDNPHFLANITENSICYTGTHDNDTLIGWWNQLSEETKKYAKENLPERDTISDSMIEAALGSPARIAVIPMQDILKLDGSARMNTPGTVGGSNWRWRMQKGALTDELADKYRELNEFYERI
ncbi:MAG: 4-alpha-glucanotransferase [Clostridia bacterium]|nr:4-alpha-glucanotransferase [Clostridia bacterium]